MLRLRALLAVQLAVAATAPAAAHAARTIAIAYFDNNTGQSGRIAASEKVEGKKAKRR